MIITNRNLPYWEITTFKPSPASNEILFTRKKKMMPIVYRTLSQEDKVAVNRKTLLYAGTYFQEMKHNPFETTGYFSEDMMTNEVLNIQDYPNHIIISKNGIGKQEPELVESYFDNIIEYNGKFYERVFFNLKSELKMMAQRGTQ